MNYSPTPFPPVPHFGVTDNDTYVVTVIIALLVVYVLYILAGNIRASKKNNQQAP